MRRNRINEEDIPQRFIDQADEEAQEDILTSVDEEAYTNGDWTERIYERAAEMWEQYIEDEKTRATEHAIEQAKGPR